MAVRERFGDERRTKILEEEGELRIEDLIADEDMAITVTNTGYVKRTAISTYRAQRRGARAGSACAPVKRTSSTTSSSRRRTPT